MGGITKTPTLTIQKSLRDDDVREVVIAMPKLLFTARVAKIFLEHQSEGLEFYPVEIR